MQALYMFVKDTLQDARKGITADMVENLTGAASMADKEESIECPKN